MTTRAEFGVLYDEYARKLMSISTYNDMRYQENQPIRVLCEKSILELPEIDDQPGWTFIKTLSYGAVLSRHIPCYEVLLVGGGVGEVSKKYFLPLIVAASFALWGRERIVQVSVSSREDTNYSDWIAFAKQYEGAQIIQFSREYTSIAILLFPNHHVSEMTYSQGKVDPS